MKHFLLLLVFITSATILTAQRKQKPKESFYVFDKEWNSISDVSKGIYFVRVSQWADTLFKWDTYNMAGPLISVEYFKDKQATIQHGECRYFDKRGVLDSVVNFRDGKLDGDLVYYNDTGRVYLTKKFSKGEMVSIKDHLKKDSTKVDTSRVFVKVEVESEFPGRIAAWRNYLQRNLRYPQRAITANAQGTVVVQFIVDTDGKIIQPEIYRSVEYSIDQEALRLIEQSPDWTPAEQNGKKVKSFKRQPISFRLS